MHCDYIGTVSQYGTYTYKHMHMYMHMHMHMHTTYT